MLAQCHATSQAIIFCKCGWTQINYFWNMKILKVLAFLVILKFLKNVHFLQSTIIPWIIIVSWAGSFDVMQNFIIIAHSYHFNITKHPSSLSKEFLYRLGWLIYSIMMKSLWYLIILGRLIVCMKLNFNFFVS